MYIISFTDSATVVLEAVSPVDMILDPPEKLVIEVESSGGYFRHDWYKNNEEIFPNGDRQFTQGNPQKFSEFFQVFVEDPTNTTHHGIYRVDLIDDDNSATVLESQEFTVTPSGKFTQVNNRNTIGYCFFSIVSLSIEALNTTAVTVVEGDDVDISCIASANPLPSNIVWSFGENLTSFTQTDTTENKTAYVPSAGVFSFLEGNITSTLHITAAEYPTHSGIYTCSSTNDTTTLNDTITVEVQGECEYVYIVT